MNLLKLIWGDLRTIADGLKDFPINILLLVLAILKALCSDTQVQLIALLAVVVGLLTNYKISLLVFLAVYILAYFITNNLNAILKLIASRMHNQ